MRVAIVPFLVAFASSAAGVIITSPKHGDKVDFSKPVTIKWRTVSSDPSTFDIVLVNKDNYPPTTETVASAVDSDKGSFTIKAHDMDLTTPDAGGGYQVNILAPSGGILAQSPHFKVTSPNAETTSSSASTSTETSTATTRTHTSTMSTPTTTTKHTKSTEESTAAATSTSNAAGTLTPGQAGSLLLGLVALAL